MSFGESQSSNENRADHGVEVHLDRLLAAQAMTLADLSRGAGVTVANLGVLKNGRARAIRFSTLAALCRVLGCQPGDLLTVVDPVSTDPMALEGLSKRQD